MKTNFSSSLRRLFVAAVIWVGVVLGAAWFDWRGLSLVQEKAFSFLRARASIAALETKRISLLEEQMRIRNRTKDLRRVQEAFVPKDAPLQFIESIERLAGKELLPLELSVPRKKEETMTMGFETNGNEQRVLAFLENLEKLPAQATIEEITFERYGNDSRDIKKKFSVEKITSVRAFGVIEFLAR